MPYHFDQDEMLSDMDYSYNSETKEFDIPAVEWDGIYGKHWERFESEEARTAKLDAYSAFCDQPEIVAYHAQQRIDSDIHGALYELSYHLDWMDGCHIVEKLSLRQALAITNSHWRVVPPHVVKAVASVVVQRNIQALRLRFPKPLSFTLGEIMN